MIVVGAAIVRPGLVLAARRSRPPFGWEFPGGKVEDGESPPAALRREIVEELGVHVVVRDRLAVSSIAPDVELWVYLASVEPETVPVAGPDHDELRWITVAQLDDLGWLEPDRAAVAALRAWL